jgi:folate-binding Fe-S cluster repair protein YgfZ
VPVAARFPRTQSLEEMISLLLDRSLYRLSGKDSGNFLQSLMTNCVDQVIQNGVAYTAFLNAKAKLYLLNILANDSWYLFIILGKGIARWICVQPEE